MALPWDDWFYHLSEKEDRINKQWGQYLSIRDDIAAAGEDFNKKLDEAGQLHAYIAGLLISMQMGTLNDDDYVEWLRENEIDKPSTTLDRASFVKVLSAIAELTEVAFVSEAVKRFATKMVAPALRAGWLRISGRLRAVAPVENVELSELNSQYSESVEDIGEVAEAEGEPLVEVGADEAAAAAANSAQAAVRAAVRTGGEAAEEGAWAGFVSSLSLPSMSKLALAGGIFAALGVDAILGAINGHFEAEELEERIEAMQDMLDKSRVYANQLKEKNANLAEVAEKGKKQFCQVLKHLEKIRPLPVSLVSKLAEVRKGKSSSMRAWLEAANEAQIHFGILAKIRADGLNYLETAQDSASWDTFKFLTRMTSSPQVFPDDVLYGYMDYVASNSERLGALRSAPPPKPGPRPPGPGPLLALARPSGRATGVANGRAQGDAHPWARALLPWDHWFYPGIERLQNALKQKRSQYTVAREQADNLHSRLSRDVRTYKSFVALNGVLLVTSMAALATDDEWEKYIASVAAGPESPPHGGYLPHEISNFVVEATGGLFLTRALYSVGSLVKEGLSSLGSLGADAAALEGEAAGVGFVDGAVSATGEVVAEAAAEAGAEAGLSAALPGIGFVAAVGIDAIMGALDGRRREDQLEAAVKSLDDELAKVHEYHGKVGAMIHDVEAACMKQMASFRRVVEALRQVEQPHFKYDWPETMHCSTHYLEAMEAAVDEYGILVEIRRDLSAYVKQDTLFKSFYGWQGFRALELLRHTDVTLLLDYVRANIPMAQALPVGEPLNPGELILKPPDLTGGNALTLRREAPQALTKGCGDCRVS